MKDAISLGVGEPDFTTPWNICEAAIYAIEKGVTHYSSNWGTLELRQAIAEYLTDRCDVHYDPRDEIMVTVGASEGIDLALRAILSPGDEVLVPDPGYVSYVPGVLFAHGVPVSVPTRPEVDFRLTPEDLKGRITPKTKALILPYPNNPTGAIMAREDLEAIAEVLKGTDILVLSDEIYSELTYGQKHVSFASIEGMKERTILLNGFSKAFAMTGWRLGYLCAPRELAAAIVKIHQYTILCAPVAGQAAAAEALKSAKMTDYRDVKKMLRTYDYRRRMLLKAFREMGLPCFEPKGAFYMFPNITSTGMDSETFCEELLRQQKVAVVPGTAFGESGEGFVRCSYATATEDIQEAIRRIGEFVKSHRR
ncbi:aminotransferase class I/II-fold pyridoxal phosphate-dependent enzyme [Christensenellaceae bacterium NSJ-53]|uniref:Aminotransferase n=2 Tax=Gehongia tenuis TaxID=2763655 RepID=A0A926D304_9FIRM|nr:aminotransferase class I/II-fold pyridoxal phosphate-dependent enzyme [Gehongia tenuis]